MTLRLEIASLPDLEYIVEVYNSVIPLGNVTADQEAVSVEDWTPWFQNHNSDLRPIFILYKNDEKCGWMSFSDYKSRAAYNITAELSIYLHESFRGNGLAYQFIQMGLKELRAKGLKKVMAVVYAHNDASVRLFRKLGFEDWGLMPGVCEVKQDAYDVLILGRSL